MATKAESAPKPKGMNAAQFMTLLESLNACSEAREWAKGKTMAKAWNECDNPQWMCWLLGRSLVNNKVIATIAVGFAESCAHHAKDYPAVAECIEVVKLFLAGKATQEKLSAAAESAWLAVESARSARSAAAARSARSAAESAWLAVESAWSARSAAAAWSARSAAAESARLAAESARLAAESARSAAAAWLAANKDNCDIVRKHVPASELAKLFT